MYTFQRASYFSTVIPSYMMMSYDLFIISLYAELRERHHKRLSKEHRMYPTVSALNFIELYR